jgi:hypothetical protein
MTRWVDRWKQKLTLTTRNPLRQLVFLERLRMTVVGRFVADGALPFLDKDKTSKEADRVSEETGLASEEAGKRWGGRKMEKERKREEEETSGFLLRGCRRWGWEIIEEREESEMPPWA